MATTEYRKAFAEAAGDKDKYMELCKELPERHQGTARLLWSQFTREIEPRQCICKNGGEMVNFLKRLPSEHTDFAVVTTSSDDVESGYIRVVSNPVTKTITIHGSMFD